ncbi:hypothetical protein [Curtobacterium sp. SL109]|uniref:hypothetical protein n=1 Tax=Curtobacterium sp. SL109 TaxID=2994662 RepID=UPI002275A91D|nr:hypothetical protein [Curtobacterium sp. SL109]MCY1694364.1 hypothetical protein [Curtobacterium sp. SL109]
MRVVVSVLMIVVATALTLGAALLVVFGFADADRTLRIGSATAAPFLVMGPVAIGGLAGYWDHRASPESRRLLGWWFAGVAAIDVVAAVFIVLAALSARAPVWVPTLLVVGGAVLLGVARPLGALFRRTEPPMSSVLDHSVIEPPAVRRAVRVVVVTFVVAAVVASVAAGVLLTLGRRDPGDVAQAVLLAGQLTFTATAVSAAFVSLPFSGALRDTGGRDIGRLRRFAEVVLRGKPVPLDDIERQGSVEYAKTIQLVLQFQLAFFGLLSTGLTFQFVSSALRGTVSSLVFFAGLVVALVVLVPLTVRRIRRARRYVRQHDHVVDTQTVVPS